MRLPSMRFTIRDMTLFVVIVGVGLGMAYRSKRLRQMGDDHWARHASFWGISYRKSWWHFDLTMKYWRAARYPWLPVEPDPPEPE
jgi:hypothetical protein